MRATWIALLAGISALALPFSPGALAADIPIKAPRVVPSLSNWWIEGGASHVGGDPYVLGLNNPPFDVMPKAWGWQGAAGFDHRITGSPWHVGAAFRYTSNGSNGATSSPVASFAGPTTLTGTNSADRKEHNWAADFSVGRDMGIGLPTLVKFGIRVAEIWGRTSGQAQWAPLGSGVQVRSYDQTNKFLGVGPRLSADGSIPLRYGWSFDYNGGVAGLWGRRSVDQTVIVSGTFGGGGIACTTGCPIAGSDSSNGFVFNADAQAGLAYAITRSAKLSVNYRYEGYWKALRGYDSAGSPVNLNRTYHGPTIRLNVQY